VFWEFLAYSKQPTYQFLCFVLIGSHQFVSNPGFFLLNSKKCLPKMIDFPQKKPYTRQHKKIKEQELGNSGFFITTRPATRSVTKERQQEEMDQRLENMEQSMKSLSNSHEEFRKSQQTLQYLMTEIYEMLAKTSNGENSRGRNHEYE
jgi:hypothetical protein